MSAHTKGPWFVGKDSAHPWIVQCSTNVPDLPATVCEVGYKPNARLIAVAPELLAELVSLVNQIIAAEESPDIEPALSLIAKATGA